MTSDKLLNSPSNCLVFTLETKENLKLHQESLRALFHVPLQLLMAMKHVYCIVS